MTSTQSMQAIALQHEVEQFLYREAALLDNRQFNEWLELLADDVHYWMPIRRTVTLAEIDREFTRIGDMAFFDDDKNDLAMRVGKLHTGSSWSEDPPSRTRHNVSNVRVTEVQGDEISVSMNFHLYRARLDEKTDNWTGRREDKLRRSNNGFVLCQRHIFLDQTVIQSTNMSSLF